MARFTPSIAKNLMARALRAVLDPLPSAAETKKLWSYFKSRCAYCNGKLDKRFRTAHLDHLRPAAAGGSNSVYNHVLACAKCNGDLKREKDWQEFLVEREPDQKERQAREARIQGWLNLAPNRPAVPEADAIIQAALRAFDEAVVKMRELRTSGTP